MSIGERSTNLMLNLLILGISKSSSYFFVHTSQTSQPLKPPGCRCAVEKRQVAVEHEIRVAPPQLVEEQRDEPKDLVSFLGLLLYLPGYVCGDYIDSTIKSGLMAAADLRETGRAGG
jgi:hypothetical protein